MGQSAPKGTFTFLSRNALLGRRSTPPGMVCMLLCPWIWQWAPCVSPALPTFCRGRNVRGQAGGPIKAAWGAGALQELWVMGDAAAVAFTQAAQVTPMISPWCPEAQCTGGDHSYWGRVGVMCRKERRDKPSDSDVGLWSSSLEC